MAVDGYYALGKRMAGVFFNFPEVNSNRNCVWMHIYSGSALDSSYAKHSIDAGGNGCKLYVIIEEDMRG